MRLFKDSDFTFLNKHLIQPLKSWNIKVYIFGSRAIGKHHLFSDSDILISGKIDEETYVLISKNKEFFEESNFPVKLDLVIEADLAKSYLQSILKKRIEF